MHHHIVYQEVSEVMDNNVSKKVYIITEEPSVFNYHSVETET